MSIENNRILGMKGMALRLPKDFSQHETMLSFREKPLDQLEISTGTGAQIKLEQKVRPNMIMHQRQARKSATLEELTGELQAELLQSIGEMENLETLPFKFQDENEGVLLSFDCALTANIRLKQIQVLRLDQDLLTSLTLTLSADISQSKIESDYLPSLRTLHPEKEL